MTEQSGRIIVKVQTALNGPTLPALIYDRTRVVFQQAPVDQVAKRMAGRVKAFFYARVSHGQVTLESEAPWQSW